MLQHPLALFLAGDGQGSRLDVQDGVEQGLQRAGLRGHGVDEGGAVLEQDCAQELQDVVEVGLPVATLFLQGLNGQGVLADDDEGQTERLVVLARTQRHGGVVVGHGGGEGGIAGVVPGGGVLVEGVLGVDGQGVGDGGEEADPGAERAGKGPGLGPVEQNGNCRVGDGFGGEEAGQEGGVGGRGAAEGVDREAGQDVVVVRVVDVLVGVAEGEAVGNRRLAAFGAVWRSVLVGGVSVLVLVCVLGVLWLL